MRTALLTFALNIKQISRYRYCDYCVMCNRDHVVFCLLRNSLVFEQDFRLNIGKCI